MRNSLLGEFPDTDIWSLFTFQVKNHSFNKSQLPVPYFSGINKNVFQNKTTNL